MTVDATFARSCEASGLRVDPGEPYDSPDLCVADLRPRDLLAPTPSLRVKNTFIDGWPESPPPPLQLQKHESCPAAFAPRLAESLEEAASTEASLEGLEEEEEDTTHWRFNGQALEVYLDASSCAGPARLRVAAVLGLSPARISICDSRTGQCLEDHVLMSDLHMEDLSIDVASEEDAKRSEIVYQLTTALNEVCQDNSTASLMRCLDAMKIVTQIEVTLVMKFVISLALKDLSGCEHYADVIAALHTRYPSFASAESGEQPISFTRILRTACQEEYDALLLSPGTKKSEDRNSADQRTETLVALCTFFGKLYVRHLLLLKVVEYVVRDLLWPRRGLPETAHVDCVCQLLGEIMAAMNSSKEGSFLDQVLVRLAHLKDVLVLDPEQNPFIGSEGTRCQIEHLLELRGKRLFNAET